MLLISFIILLLVNAVTSRRDRTIYLNRVAILILLYSGILGHEILYSRSLDTGIGIYGGLFHSTIITHSFDLFIYILGAIVLQLTAFYPRRFQESTKIFGQFTSLFGTIVLYLIFMSVFHWGISVCSDWSCIALSIPRFPPPPRFS